MAGRLEEYEEDHVIIWEGKPNNKMYVVLEGAVVLYMNYGKENEYVIGVRGKDKIFGEMSMLAEEDSMYTAVALSNVKLAWFQLNNLNQFLNGYPDSAVNFLKAIAKNNSLMRKNFMMLTDELDEANKLLIKKDAVIKYAAKISANGLYGDMGIGFGGRM